ncbi:hypothetical protein [Aeromonas caviae]
MSKHTQEPWPFFVEWAEPSTPHPESEPIVRLSYDDYQRARYCVNACQGVSNGQLTLTSVSGAILMLKEAEQQRDELLAALEKLSGDVEALMKESGGVYGLHQNGEPAPWGDLVAGGRHEEWLLSLSDAAELVAKLKAGAS